jgi:hypothetical protein
LLTGSFDRVSGPRSASGAVYGEFAGAPSREELERFFFLDDADKARVATRRSDSSCAASAAAVLSSSLDLAAGV